MALRLLLCGFVLFTAVVCSVRTADAGLLMGAPVESEAPAEEGNEAEETAVKVDARRQEAEQAAGSLMLADTGARGTSARRTKPALARATSGHVLANGLRAPLRC
jgi:hypothetical protein